MTEELVAYLVQGYYGVAWEDLVGEDTRKEANQRLQEYRENAPETCYRVVKRVEGAK